MYSHLVLGGTFDQFHIGHQDLLSLAFAKSKKVTLGLTKASMNRTKEYSGVIQSYRLRRLAVEQFASNVGRLHDLTIVPIDSLYGTTLVDSTLQAILVTELTLPGALLINQERQRIGLPTLRVELCPLRLDSRGQVVSSSRIRRGQIDQTGAWHEDVFHNTITVSLSAKEALRRPFGKSASLSSLRNGHNPIVVIGDIATEFCCRHGIKFRAAFIDGLSQRMPYSFSTIRPYHQKVLSFENHPGTITNQVKTLIDSSLLNQLQTIFKIQGEEDLLAVACVILLPLGTRVVYGYPYPPKGMRLMTITPRLKLKFKEMLCL